MFIDLHCHTKKTKSGDPDSRNVDVEKFADKISRACIEIVAITNHNSFDKIQFEKFSEAVIDNCQIWPGIELDIDIGETGKNGHLIVISNPKSIDIFNEKIEKLINNMQPDECAFTVEQIYNTLKDCDVIYIPHLHKANSIPFKVIEKLESMLEEKHRLFNETSDYRSLGVYANHDYRVMIGSDVKDWNNYENSTFAKLRLPVKSFEHFCLLAKKDKLVINTLLNKKNTSNISVSPHPSVSIEVPIHQDINIIFGQKGTGKSELLKSLKNYYDRKSIQCEYYVGTSRDVDFDRLKDISGISRNAEIVNAETCKSNFEKLNNWEDKSPTLFRHFIDWYETKDNNNNKKKMKITEATRLIYIDDTELDKKEKELLAVKSILKALSSIRLEKYIDSENKTTLLKIVGNLESKVHEKLVSEYIEKEAVNLANYSIDMIKQFADACSDTKSRPSTTGIYDFITNRIKLYNLAKEINSNIRDKKSEEKDLIGTLDDKGSIYLLTRYQMLNKSSTRFEFNIGIRALRNLKGGLHTIEDRFFLNNIKESVLEIVDLCDENSVTSTSCFLGISKTVVTDDNQEYNPSKGECGILLLQKQLRKISDVYILDEPELGMGNSYINNTILPQLMNLVESKKTIIIATHNANIAVRTLPYISIFRTHKNGNYKTYVGNPYIDELQNIEDEKDIIIWSTESMKTLEGGKAAFYERKIIYESGR